MYSTSIARRSSSVVQKPSGVAARLVSSAPKRVTIDKAGTFAGIEIPSLPGSTAVKNNEAKVNKQARPIRNYKAGKYTATFHPERKRTFQPGISWLGDDEFEFTGLASQLARHHGARETAKESTGDSGFRRRMNANANSGSFPRSKDKESQTRTQARAPKNTGKKAPEPRRNLTRSRRPEPAEAPKTTSPGTPKRPTTPQPTLKLSPAPQPPAYVGLESTDFTSLFGASSSLSRLSSPASSAIIPMNTASRRAQLSLERHGGDYSRLVPDSFVSSQGDPLAYAASVMARRRDMGPNMRSNALEIVRGMIGKSLDADQPRP